MKSVRKLIIVLFIFCSPALMAKSFYAGGSVGKTNYKHFCDSNISACDNKPTGWKAFGGLFFNKNFGLEGGYTDLGRATFVNGWAEGDLLNVGGIAAFQPIENFELFAKYGAVYWRIRATDFKTEEDFDTVYGGGMQYAFTKTISLRAEWEHFPNLGNATSGEIDVDLESLSMIYTF